MEEAAVMQGEALREVGLQSSSRNLALLRDAALRHPDIALYVRHNLNRDAYMCNDSIPIGSGYLWIWGNEEKGQEERSLWSHGVTST